jgi:hypothetical protein
VAIAVIVVAAFIILGLGIAAYFAYLTEGFEPEQGKSHH